MAEEYISQSEFARRVGTTQASVSRGRNKGHVKTTRGGKVKYKESLDLWFNYEGTKQAQAPDSEKGMPEPPKGKKPNAPEPDVSSDPMISDTAIEAIEDTFFESQQAVK